MLAVSWAPDRWSPSRAETEAFKDPYRLSNSPVKTQALAMTLTGRVKALGKHGTQTAAGGTPRAGRASTGNAVLCAF